jgi:hypothetical protein
MLRRCTAPVPLILPLIFDLPCKSCRFRNGMLLSICTIVVLSFIMNMYEQAADGLAIVFQVCLHSQLALPIVGTRKRRETYHDYCGSESRDPV